MNHAGLYIHIPFCQAKCGYCSFNSIPAHRELTDKYLDLVKAQAEYYSKKSAIQDIHFDSIFFGGGTPTLASPEKLAQLLTELTNLFSVQTTAEISTEANPNSIDVHDLTTLRHAGFNRLSLGVQSFQDHILQRINRTHSGTQAREAIVAARKAGFTNINCDLIYGLPQQSCADWQKDLQIITTLQPKHLSLYELSVEQNTAFHTEQQAGTLHLPEEEHLADMEDISKDLLTPHFDQYEISNFAKSGHQCRHNLTYWQNSTYLGLGAGAVSCIDGVRFTHQPAPHLFMAAIQQQKPTITHTEQLPPHERFRETMIMGLRLVQGVNLRKLEQNTNLSHQQVYGDVLNNLINKGYLKKNPPYIYIPKNFLGVANQILHQLV